MPQLNDETSGIATRAAIVARLSRRTAASGSLSVPCLPALLERYLHKVEQLFDVLDRPLTSDELARFRQVLAARLEEGFRASPYSRLILSYEPSASNPLLVDCTISIVAPSLAEQYREWLRTTAGEQPFGTYPDAKVMELARALDRTANACVLDVGAGSGRNALALTRLGLTVHALEPVPELAQRLRSLARDGASVSVFETDVSADAAELPPGAYALIIVSEVMPHFSRSEATRVVEKLARALAPGGTLLLNVFLTRPGYEPDDLAYQAAQTLWSTFFTRTDLSTLTAALGLELREEAPCIEYERARSPEDTWPPTPWYENWARGHNLFSVASEDAPIELCWLEYRLSEARGSR